MSNDSIYLSSYDNKWPEMAAKEIAFIRETLPNVKFEIEHIGSTAIAGLSAKPIIDLRNPCLIRVLTKASGIFERCFEFVAGGNFLKT